MSWTKLLEREIGYTYAAAVTLMRRVDADTLDWKPAVSPGAQSTGWMSIGQLLQHLTGACGVLCECFLRGDWSAIQGGDPSAPLPSTASVDAAIEGLLADRERALAAVHEAGDDRMESVRVTAPWGLEGSLGEQFVDCVKHLGQHKGQLFYYLKMLGKPVHTGHLWGMEG